LIISTYNTDIWKKKKEFFCLPDILFDDDDDDEEEDDEDDDEMEDIGDEDVESSASVAFVLLALIFWFALFV